MPKILSHGALESSSPTAKSYSAGVSSAGASVPWKPDSENPLAQAILDIDWLVAQPMLPFLAQVIPAQVLYRSLVAHGFDDCVELMEWVRGAQLQKVLDFDLWNHSSELEVDDISVDKFMSWLKIWLQIGTEFAADRFCELEEETIMLIVSKLFEIIPEGVSQVTEDMRENWWVTHDKKFYLRMRIEDSDHFEMLKIFIDALYQKDARFAESIFAYSTMLVRQETLQDGQRWRQGRLSDQGFVLHDEALNVLAPKEKSAIKKLFLQSFKLEENRKEAFQKSLQNPNSLNSIGADFDPDLLENIANFLAVQEPEEGIRYMQMALGEESIKQIAGSSRVAPECFYEDDDFIVETAEKIIEKCQKLLVRNDFAVARQINKKELLIEQVLSEISEQNSQNALFLKQRVAHISNTLVAAFMNGFDGDSLVRSLALVKGSLNIGLLELIEHWKDYGIASEPKANKVDNGLYLIEHFGPEIVFQVGWNLLLSLGQETACALADSGIARQRHFDIQTWLNSIEHKLASEVFFVLEALLGRVPMYPELLSTDTVGSTKKSFHRVAKPFETLEEIHKVKLFIANITSNLNLESL